MGAGVTSSIEDINTYLERNQKKELLRFLTCGSVDDGKSTLIGRLLHDTKGIYEDQLAAVRKDSVTQGTTGGAIDLALLTDGLKAEREQGITIDVAYRYFSTDKRKFIIADTPGHEQYTRNMATGASTCQLAIILIDARHGVMSQTKRHSFICSLLGIKHLVVAINKMDLVGFSEEAFTRIRDQYSDFVAKLEIKDVTFIPLSALSGDNVVSNSPNMPWYKGTPLLNHLESVHIASDRNLIDMRFPVQYVVRPNLDFRGFAGTVASGVIRKGDEVMALPSRKKSRVKSIVTYEGELEEAFPPLAVTVTLEDEVDISRGDMLVYPGNVPRVASDVEAMVVWMNEKPLATGRSYWIKHTTKMVAGEVTAIRYGIDVNTLHRRPANGLELNEVGRCVISLNQPIAYDPYSKNAATGAFIVIDRLTNTTVAAGMILDHELGRGTGDVWETAPVPTTQGVKSEVSGETRAAKNKQRPATILLTGLSGAGKQTIAFALEKKLLDLGHNACVLYGQNMRQGLSRDLGFSSDDRSENLRRSAEVARILNDAGMICISAFVAPHEAVRQKAKQVIGADRYLEVYLSAPIDVCKTRERTGIYQRAEAGEIKSVPGVSAAYEAPAAPDLVVPTHEISLEESVERILAFMKKRSIVAFE
jgi:bifunctional enzyme CysN/CysC